jgi:hypothetical protein
MKLTLDVPKCPKCGEIPHGMRATVRAFFRIKSVAKGFEIGSIALGNYRLDMKSNEVIELVCGGGHEWISGILEES